MKNKPSYTEIYSFREKFRKVTVLIVMALMFLVVYKLWLYPIQDEFLASFYCTDDGFNDFKLIFRVFFLLFLMVPLYGFSQAYKIFKYKQFPFPNQKSDYKRKICYGDKAQNRAWFIVHMSIILVAFITFAFVKIEDEYISKIDYSTIDRSDCIIVIQNK